MFQGWFEITFKLIVLASINQNVWPYISLFLNSKTHGSTFLSYKMFVNGRVLRLWNCKMIRRVKDTRTKTMVLSESTSLHAIHTQFYRIFPEFLVSLTDSTQRDFPVPLSPNRHIFALASSPSGLVCLPCWCSSGGTLWHQTYSRCQTCSGCWWWCSSGPCSCSLQNVSGHLGRRILSSHRHHSSEECTWCH